MHKMDGVNKLTICFTLHFQCSSLSNRACLFEAVKMAQEYRTRGNSQSHGCINSVLGTNINPL